MDTSVEGDAVILRPAVLLRLATGPWQAFAQELKLAFLGRLTVLLLRLRGVDFQCRLRPASAAFDRALA